MNVALQSTLLIALLAGEPAVAPPSFTGTWLPDKARSTQSKTLKEAADSGIAPAPPAAISDDLPVMRVAHGDGRVVIEFLDGDGSVISATAMTTDGAENVNPRAGGALTHRSKSVWKGTVLHTTWTIEREGRVAISGTEDRELLSAAELRVTTRTEDSKSKSESVILYRLKR